MQTPQRKLGKFSHLKPDPFITRAKYIELENKLKKLKNSQPYARSEVRRLAEMGDFSENHAYQMAKGRLRGINQQILDIEDHLKRSEIINEGNKTNVVLLGSVITIEVNGKQKNLQLLGSSETNPKAGVISHNSLVGAALLGRKVGEVVKIKLPVKEVEYKIIKVA
ncbi:GreA/GreB family elongation factor [Patescibacteria group bacterium]|nr:GreA/GreB family elongation factor [Patescibacteria group bacterium]